MKKTPAKEKINLIIADDHRIMGEGLERILREIEFINKIHLAVNGEEVMSLIEKNKIHLIFMDIELGTGEANGIELTLLVKKTYPEIKIIALSMHDESSYIEDMFHAGASGYLLKNTNFNQIEECIRRIAYMNKICFSPEVGEVLLNAKKREEVSFEKKIKFGKRQVEIWKLIQKGLPSKLIADDLDISIKTVSNVKDVLHKKTNTRNDTELIEKGIKLGILKQLMV